MKKLYIPRDESELVFLKSFLEAEGMPFYVLNDTFGSVYPGIYTRGFNAKTIMVPEELFEDAKELIKSAVDDPKFVDEEEEDTDQDQGGVLQGLLSLKWLFPKKDE